MTQLEKQLEASIKYYEEERRQRTKPLVPFEMRFWSYVRFGLSDDCWEWEGYRHPWGYGSISLRNRALAAHRVSWELQYGPIPAGLHVLHECDNPPCVNPAHLFLGTQADNNADKHLKGRGAPPPVRVGEANNKARLTAAQVCEIRERYARGGVSIRELAKEYGVTFAPIQMLLSGKTWRHV